MSVRTSIHIDTGTLPEVYTDPHFPPFLYVDAAGPVGTRTTLHFDSNESMAAWLDSARTQLAAATETETETEAVAS